VPHCIAGTSPLRISPAEGSGWGRDLRLIYTFLTRDNALLVAKFPFFSIIGFVVWQFRIAFHIRNHLREIASFLCLHILPLRHAHVLSFFQHNEELNVPAAAPCRFQDSSQRIWPL
jgi:hypothetical protein